jgi:hypothetical protein
MNVNVREDSVLQPRNAANVNPDNWAQFNIDRVKVTSQKTGGNISLLSAHQHNPVKVSGKLERVENDLIHLGNTTSLPIFMKPQMTGSSTRQEIPR